MKHRGFAVALLFLVLFVCLVSRADSRILKLHSDQIRFAHLDVSKLLLDYSDSSLAVEVSALDFSRFEKSQYKFKLEGFDEKWVRNDAGRDVTYTNLDPGKYTLRVLGSNKDGVWSEWELKIPILVNAPPWATWRAYVIFVVFACSLLYLSFQYINRRERKEADERFNDRLRLYLSSLDETLECVFNASPAGLVLFANNTAWPMLGKEPSEIIGFPLFEILFQNEQERSAARSHLDDAGSYLAEIPFEMNDGLEKVLEVSISTVDQPGVDVAYVGVARDVTEKSAAREQLQKERDDLAKKIIDLSEELGKTKEEAEGLRQNLVKSSEEKDRLLREIHARVNDNLHMLTSLLSIQTSKTVDPALVRILEDNQQRVKTVSLAHEHLHDAADLHGVDMAAYVDSLASAIYRAFQPGAVKIHFQKFVDEGTMDIEQAVPCGLIINELLTNSLEHGYAEKKHGSGKVSLSFEKTPRDFVLTVSDDGRGIPVDFNPRAGNSMGLEIVSILTDQLDGEFKFIGGLGTTFEVRFPVYNWSRMKS